MTPNIYALAQLCTSAATLLGVIFAFINSLRNGRKIDDVHMQTQSIKKDVFSMTGRVYIPTDKVRK
jgi:hypothetical protein